MCYKTPEKGCVPMVVRPHDIPKPAIAATAALSLAPVPGPCLYKKVIVKPAVLPKPVCRPTEETYSSHQHHHSHVSIISIKTEIYFSPTIYYVSFLKKVLFLVL